VGGALVSGFNPLLIDRTQPAGNGRISDLRQILASRLLSRPEAPKTFSRPA
jgi:hypothetical protein